MDNWEKAGYESYDEYERAAWCSYNDYINNWGSGFLIQVIHEIGISYYMWKSEKDMYFIPETEVEEHLEGEIRDLMFLDYEHVFNGYILTSYQIDNFNNKLYVMSEFVANYLNAIECKERLFQIRDKMITENAQLHCTIEELNSEIDTLKETLHKEDDKIKELNTSVSYLSHVKDEQKQDIEHQRTIIEREEKKREAYRLQCSEHIDYINDLEKECEEYKENINDLATQIEDMERVHNDLIGERKQLEEENRQLKAKITVNALYETVEHLTCENARLYHEIEKYDAQMKDLLDTIETEKASNHNMNQRQQAFFEENERLKEEIKSLNIKLDNKNFSCHLCTKNALLVDNERLKKSLSVEHARRDTYEEEIKHLKRDKEDLQKKCTDLQRFKDIHENFWTKYQKLIQTSIYEYLMGKIDEGIHPFNVYYKLLQEGRHKTCEELFRASYITYEQYAKLKFSLNKQEGKQ